MVNYQKTQKNIIVFQTVLLVIITLALLVGIFLLFSRSTNGAPKPPKQLIIHNDDTNAETPATPDPDPNNNN